MGDNLSRKKHLKFDSSFGLTFFFGGKLVLLEQSPKSSEGPLGLTRNSVCLLRDIGISGQGPDMIRSDFLKTIFIYFFGCAGSRYGVPTLCCTWRDLVPRPGIDPGPPALGKYFWNGNFSIKNLNRKNKASIVFKSFGSVINLLLSYSKTGRYKIITLKNISTLGG